MILKCAICDKEIRRYGDRVKNINFCSYSCRNKYYSSTKSFVWKGGPEEFKKRQRDRNLESIRRTNNKDKAVEYKGGKCVICGYDKNIAALDFHHIDPKTKDKDIKMLCIGRWDKVQKELDKCILLCANCHRELHWEQNKNKRDLVVQKREEYLQYLKNKPKKYHGRIVESKNE